MCVHLGVFGGGGVHVCMHVCVCVCVCVCVHMCVCVCVYVCVKVSSYKSRWGCVSVFLCLWLVLSCVLSVLSACFVWVRWGGEGEWELHERLSYCKQKLTLFNLIMDLSWNFLLKFDITFIFKWLLISSFIWLLEDGKLHNFWAFCRS